MNAIESMAAFRPSGQRVCALWLHPSLLPCSRYFLVHLCTGMSSLSLSVRRSPLNRVFSHCLHTYLLGLLVSLLTVFTPAYTLGAPSLKSDVIAYVTRLTWIRLFAELS